jgi:hypothetical protein
LPDAKAVQAGGGTLCKITHLHVCDFFSFRQFDENLVRLYGGPFLEHGPDHAAVRGRHPWIVSLGHGLLAISQQ